MSSSGWDFPYEHKAFFVFIVVADELYKKQSINFFLNLFKRVFCYLFPFNEIQGQTKLIYGNKTTVTGWYGRNFSVNGNIIYIDLYDIYMLIFICQNLWTHIPLRVIHSSVCKLYVIKTQLSQRYTNGQNHNEIPYYPYQATS